MASTTRNANGGVASPAQDSREVETEISLIDGEMSDRRSAMEFFRDQVLPHGSHTSGNSSQPAKEKNLRVEREVESGRDDFTDASFIGAEYFDRIRRQETRDAVLDRAIHALNMLGGLGVEGARPFQLAIASLNNASRCGSAAVADRSLLRSGRDSLELAAQHLRDAQAAALQCRELACVHELLASARDALLTHYEQLSRPVRQVSIDAGALADRMIVNAAQRAFDYYVNR